YEVIKVGKKFDETKLLADGFKISKTMHDIFVCLCKLVNLEETKIRKLQIPGILHLGLKLQVLQINLIRVLVSIWKKMIKDNIKIVFTVQNSNNFKQKLLDKESLDGIDAKLKTKNAVLLKQIMEESTKYEAENVKLKAKIAKLEQIAKENTKDHSGKKKDIISNLLLKIEHSSTQSESSTELEISITFLSQNIISTEISAYADDNLAES
ncbi:11306_t:CDS:2, partial [Cetraspora pellucida]